jgi:hypothetical protein
MNSTCDSRIAFDLSFSRINITSDTIKICDLSFSRMNE